MPVSAESDRSVEMSGQGIEGDGVAVRAETQNDAEADTGEHRVMPEFLSGMHVREVGLHDR